LRYIEHYLLFLFSRNNGNRDMHWVNAKSIGNREMEARRVDTPLHFPVRLIPGPVIAELGAHGGADSAEQP
jgi:hypothetical protein